MAKKNIEEIYPIFSDVRAEIGDKAMLDTILAWWGTADLRQFLTECQSELGIEFNEDIEDDDLPPEFETCHKG